MNMNHKFPIMQAHLDFHTSPYIENIGENFSKENFQAALRLGNLDSITVFAKCHHGVCYYPTKVGTMHPNLKFDLTGAMIEAAHEIGVRAPVYITAGWSELDATEHPQWISLNKDKAQITTGNYQHNLEGDQPKLHCAWQTLCFNDGGEYARHIYDLTEEVCSRYEKVDGLFYDICVVNDACYCESCIKGMLSMGFDPENEAHAKRYFKLKRTAFMQRCGDIMRKYHPNATIFFNSGGAHQYKPDYHKYQTHFEMEDLPTAWGGYDKLPLRAKFFSNYQKGYIGMTGKFHLDWGEFGGFKSKEALRAEIATMAIYGAGCSIGDHMHPDGEMEMQTYENIGYAYSYLEKIAPLCYGGETVTNLGLYTSPNGEANQGVSSILIQNQLDYDLVYEDNFERFDTVIFPEDTVLGEDSLNRLKEYLAGGGKALLMANALVKNGEFQIDTGLKYLGPAEFDCDYIMANEKHENIPNAPMLCNIPGHRTENINADISATFITPYFSRTQAHFCGHKNTPHNKNSIAYPAIAHKDNIVYVSHSLSRQYNKYGSVGHKHYFIMALDKVYGGGLLRVKGMGASGRCTVIEQKNKNRYCINMVYITPVHRGLSEIIEDIMPIYNIKAEFITEKNVKRVYLGLSEEDLDFKKNNKGITFTVPNINCHTCVVVEY